MSRLRVRVTCVRFAAGRLGFGPLIGLTLFQQILEGLSFEVLLTHGLGQSLVLVAVLAHQVGVSQFAEHCVQRVCLPKVLKSIGLSLLLAQVLLRVLGLL